MLVSWQTQQKVGKSGNSNVQQFEGVGEKNLRIKFEGYSVM